MEVEVMKVYELIEALKKVDINKSVFLYTANNDIHPLLEVNELSDRVDLNIAEGL
jgi:hypothetical protein